MKNFFYLLSPCLLVLALLAAVAQSSGGNETGTVLLIQKTTASPPENNTTFSKNLLLPISTRDPQNSPGSASDHVIEVQDSNINTTALSVTPRDLTVFQLAPVTFPWYLYPWYYQSGKAQDPISTPKSRAAVSMDSGSAVALLVALGVAMFALG